MNVVQLSTDLFVKLAGWEVLKEAKGILAMGRVLSSHWEQPILKGVVQEGTISYRAGLVLKSTSDVENMCSCRTSQRWGTICAHSIAVGLREIQGPLPPPVPPNSSQNRPTKPTPAAKPSHRLLRAAEGGLGTPAELGFLLPPNFPIALSKGRVMLVVEASWKQGRTPLNALPLDVAFSWSAQDAALLDLLEGFSATEVPAMLMLSTAQFATILPLLVGHRHLTMGRTHALQVLTEPRRMTLEAMLQPAGEIRLRILPLPASVLTFGNPTVWTFSEDRFQALGLPDDLVPILTQPERISREQVPVFLLRLPTLRETLEIQANFDEQSFTSEIRPLKVRLAMTGGLAQLGGSLFFNYGDIEIPAASRDHGLTVPLKTSPTAYLVRDMAQEMTVRQRLMAAGFAPEPTSGDFQIKGQDAVLNFFARHHPRFLREWTVTLEERLERVTMASMVRIEPQFEIRSSGEQWFDVAVSYGAAGGQRFNPAEIQRLLRSGQSHTRLPSGKIGVFDALAMEDLQEVLVDCAPQQHAGGYKIHAAQAGFLEATLRQQPTWAVNVSGDWRERVRRQHGEVEMKAPPLGELDQVLRPYQKQGVAWLWFLRDHRLGGVLADEMGLGKTLQALAFLQSTLPSNQGRPSLVVCPTSLVFNWVAEAAKFTPQLKVLALHGSRREQLFAEIPKNHLIVTSYALIRRDAALYGGIEFDTVVLDEAQHIKNRQTQNAQAVKAIRASHRLVLTGTPMENSVLDLWSIFDFLMPGYLGQAKDFKERYEFPITREKDSGAQKRLTRRVRPFLLRRLKRDVVTELPAKLEQVSYCTLSPDQLELYQQFLEAGRNEVSQALGQGGLQQSRFAVLNVLLRLRQVCCDPRLLKLESNGKKAPTSGKVELFTELLEEVIDGGHRVLVFSQFVQMLHLIRDQLEAQAIEYCYLDGSTVDRGKEVQRFQSTSTIPVFLISLKAGGVGLNLTGADTVIHFDPWWNPAVEDQATDRAHRIGQNRVVTSYKLITRGTVEEKILNLQNRKRELIQATIEGEEQLAQSLSWEEIQDLLS